MHGSSNLEFTWKQVAICQGVLFGSDISKRLALDVSGMSRDKKALHTSRSSENFRSAVGGAIDCVRAS